MSEIENVLDQYADLVKAGALTNMAPLLPTMFSIRGNPFSLKDHLMWEPLFNTQVPKKRTVVCGRQVGKCIQESTRLLRADGSLVIARDVLVGDELMCLDETNESWRAASGTVTHVFAPQQKPMLHITTHGGSDFVISTDHRLRALRGYVKAQELATGSRVCSIRDNEERDVFWDIIKSIEEVGEQKAIDFEVETHHNFVLAGGVVTHNSETSAVQILLWQLVKEFTNILYVAPRDNQTTIFSNDKIAPYIDHSPVFANRNTKLPNGTYKRSVAQGSNIYFSYAFLDAERIRSITAGAIFYDEAQDINPTFLVPIQQTLAASLDFGVTQSTGTPKTFDNNLETQWAESSQGEWCIPCYNCKKLNVPAVEFDLLKMIQPHGLACAKCGKLLQTRGGWWEHRYPQRRLRHEGYHGPQPIFPMHCEKQPTETGEVGQKWQELLYYQESMPTYGFYNEILGTSYDNASELISKTALVENSTLDHDNSYEAAIKLAHNRSKYVYVTMGVDWGGGGESGVSRTAIVILGWRSNAKPDVIYMDRILNPLPTDQEALFIKQMAQRFKVDLVADDYCGAGEAKEVILLQTGFPHEKLMPIAYVPSRVSKMMEYVPAEDKVSRPYVKVARTKSLTIMAALVNNGYYTFPKFESWDAKEYPNNLLSLVQEKRDSTRGPASYFITHKANRADDLAHAINYASIGYWFVTKNTPDFSKLLSPEFIENGL